MSSRLSSERIKAEAKDLGFFACGIAKAERVDTDAETELAEWLGKGMNADMAYMANHTDKRLDPRLLMDGLKSIICVAMNYAPACRMPKDELQFAAYALGQDYHFIVKERLRLLAERLGLHSYRVFCDGARTLLGGKSRSRVDWTQPSAHHSTRRKHVLSRRTVHRQGN